MIKGGYNVTDTNEIKKTFQNIFWKPTLIKEGKSWWKRQVSTNMTSQN